ncbi:hypothetical protein LSTR_LSTR004553 [Laodelphax striatellus]|uniref:Uncharacterized protein n=1 Tax=Laodelphax striatellus TaxID=195883 RepID=A0A482WTD1_LAOST|nr:hypothetical protein LSTR_LSTR004553 [Laodelphax striatellus]
MAIERKSVQEPVTNKKESAERIQLKRELLSARSLRNSSENSPDVKKFNLVGNSINYHKRSHSSASSKEKTFFNPLRNDYRRKDPVAVEERKENEKKMESELSKKNEEYKKHSGGVNKALIRKRRDLRQGKQEAAKKQVTKKRMKMDHFRTQVPRTPLHLSITSFPNLNIDFHGGGEAPMFLDTAHAQRTIVQVLSQYYMREENESICSRDEVLDGSELSFKSEPRSDSDSMITTEAYLQEAYNYLYHQHVNTLTKLVGEAKLENIENNTKKRLHIGQHYFLQNNEGDENLKSPGDNTQPQVANEDSNDEASDASDVDDNEEKQKLILSSMKEHLDLSQAANGSDIVQCSSSPLPENSTMEKPGENDFESENALFEDFQGIQITTTSPTIILSESRTESLDYSNHLADYEDFLIHRDSEESTVISRPNSPDSIISNIVPE